MTIKKIENAVSKLALLLQERDASLIAAESCTGGLLAKFCTDVSGSSNWFEGGVVSYTNELKQAVLKVSKNTIKKLGAVSEQTAKEMVLGVCGLSKAKNTRYGVSITGIAGPNGGTAEKPVGTVCFAWARAEVDKERTIIKAETKLFKGNRKQVREQSVMFALQELLNIMKN